jgi:hypothetical protein
MIFFRNIYASLSNIEQFMEKGKKKNVVRSLKATAPGLLDTGDGFLRISCWGRQK